MRDLFPGYYVPTEEEFKKLWAEGLIVLDANVLLNLYRYPEQARNDLLSVFERVSERLWIPHQVALEYQNNRLLVIAEQVKRFSEVKEVLRKTLTELESGLNRLQLKKRHSLINPEELVSQIKNSIEEFEKKLSDLEKKQPDVFSIDEIRDEIDQLLKGKVGAPPVSQDEVNKIYVSGKKRFDLKIPPGYEDRGKGQLKYFYRGFEINREYGDLLLWMQLIEYVKGKGIKNVIFVTDDDKEDWWRIIQSSGSKKIGPRVELIDEIVIETGVDTFWMYNSERFLELAEQYLSISVKRNTIELVGEIATVLQEDNKLIATKKLFLNENLVATKVAEWLRNKYPSDNIQTNYKYRGKEFDIVRIDSISNVIAYEVKFLQELDSFIMNSLYESYINPFTKIVSEWVFVLIFDNIFSAVEAENKLDNTFAKLSSKNYIVGVITDEQNLWII